MLTGRRAGGLTVVSFIQRLIGFNERLRKCVDNQNAFNLSPESSAGGRDHSADRARSRKPSWLY